MEDNLNILANGRQPPFLLRWTVAQTQSLLPINQNSLDITYLPNQHKHQHLQPINKLFDHLIDAIVLKLTTSTETLGIHCMRLVNNNYRQYYIKLGICCYRSGGSVHCNQLLQMVPATWCAIRTIENLHHFYLFGEPGGGGGGPSSSLSVSPMCWVITVMVTFLYFFLTGFSTGGVGGAAGSGGEKSWSGDPWPGRTPSAYFTPFLSELALDTSWEIIILKSKNKFKKILVSPLI